MDEEIVFFEDSERRETFLEENNIGSKNHQNLHFFKGVSPWFLKKKMDFFLSLVFKQNSSRKSVF